MAKGEDGVSFFRNARCGKKHALAGKIAEGADKIAAPPLFATRKSQALSCRGAVLRLFLDDLQQRLLVVAGGCGGKEGAYGFDGAPLFADKSADFAFWKFKAKDGLVRRVALREFHPFGSSDEIEDEIAQECFHGCSGLAGLWEK